MATRRGFVTQPKSKSKTIELVTKTIVLSNETAPKKLKIEATLLLYIRGIAGLYLKLTKETDKYDIKTIYSSNNTYLL